MIPLKLAKRHLVVDYDRDDTLILSYISAAVMAAEKHCNRVFRERVLTATLGCFSGLSGLHKPLQSVSSIEYFDVEGDRQTLPETTYLVKAFDQNVVEGESKMGSVSLVSNQTWPMHEPREDAITVIYTSGFNAGNIPDDLRLAILILIAHFYENRDAVAPVQLYDVPMSVKSLLSPYERLAI